MNPNQLRKLSVRELEKLLELQKRILDFSLFYEQELLKKGSLRQLEETRNDALDMINLITAELKKREL